MSSRRTALLAFGKGDTSLTLAPAIGGGVAAFRWRGHDLLRPATPEALEASDPLGMACFPMVPFAGRIARRRFTFDGRAVALAPNFEGEDGAAIHGQGWRRPWRVADHTATTARLTLDHPAGDWPWDYTAEQTFALEDGALVHHLAVTNTSPSPMPAGLGLHPYFPRDPDTRLQARVSGVFMTPEGPPAPLPADWDWRDSRAITAFVDHQFRGWTEAARISWPSRGLAVTLAAEPATPFLVVYAPVEGDYFCVEPVSHQLDAVNRSLGGAGHGMVVLPPGGTASLSARFEVSVLED
jgi:aldose 1-epimerase